MTGNTDQCVGQDQPAPRRAYEVHKLARAQALKAMVAEGNAGACVGKASEGQDQLVTSHEALSDQPPDGLAGKAPSIKPKLDALAPDDDLPCSEPEHEGEASCSSSTSEEKGAEKVEAELAPEMQVSPQERLPAAASLRTVYLLNFLMVANFTVLVPKTKQYWAALGGDVETGSALTRLLPLLKAVMAWWFLWLSRAASVRQVIFTMVAGNVFGNIVFAMAPITDSRWTVLVARIILTSHEVQSVPNCYIGRAVGQRYRSEAAMHNNAWFGLGYAAGPIIAYLLEKLSKGLGLEEQGVDMLDAETLPGWFMAVVWLVFLGIHHWCFEEPALEEEEKSDAKPTLREDMPWPGMVVLSIVSLSMAVVISSWEMWTLNMAQDRWGSPLVAGGFLAANTIAILPVAMVSGRVSKLVDDAFGLLVTFTLAGCSWTLLFQYFTAPYYQTRGAEIVYYSLGSIGLLASMQLARGWLDALVSKVSPPERKQQFITWAMSIFMLGRGLGGTLGAWFENQNSWAALHTAMCLVTALLIFISLKILRPWSLTTTTPAEPSRIEV